MNKDKSSTSKTRYWSLRNYLLLDSMRETVINDEIESTAQGGLEPPEWDIALEASISIFLVFNSV